MARRRRVRVAPVQIPQFANVDQISGSNFRSYIQSTAGSPMEGIARSALQIPGGRMLDDELANIDTQISGIDSSIAGVDSSVSGVNSSIAGVDARINDPSRRKPMPSPYASAISARMQIVNALKDAFVIMRDRNLAAVRNNSPSNVMQPYYRQWASESGAFVNSLQSPESVNINSLKEFLTKNPDFERIYRVNPSAAFSAIEDIQRFSLAEQQFQQTANAGITTTMTDAERAQLQGQRANLQRERASLEGQRADLQGQRANLQGQRPRLNSEAAARLQSAARQFNQEQNAGAVAASTTRQSPQRPLTGRFGIPQTGVGISIGGFR